jgi:hypothetical protein
MLPMTAVTSERLACRLPVRGVTIALSPYNEGMFSLYVMAATSLGKREYSFCSR